MDYKVSKIHGSWDAQYGKKRVSFSVEGDEKKVSGFFKPEDVPTEGSNIVGSIVQNGDYWNFKPEAKTFVKNAPSADRAMLEKIFAEVYATRISVQSILQCLQEKGIVPQKYPDSFTSAKEQATNEFGADVPF